jgi:hypothetical protein
MGIDISASVALVINALIGSVRRSMVEFNPVWIADNIIGQGTPLAVSLSVK